MSIINQVKIIVCMIGIFLVSVPFSSPLQALSIVEVSIPVNSQDANCHPRTDGVWDWTGGPYSGIGYITDPTYSTANIGQSNWDTALHDHVYISPSVPDPSRAVVTYIFDQPVIVEELTIIQHTNGITAIEGFAGDSLGSLVSIGTVFGPRGDVHGNLVFVEGESNTFDFHNMTHSGKYFQFVVRETNLGNGYANYRAYPVFTGVPEPATILLLSLGLIGLAGVRRKVGK